MFKRESIRLKYSILVALTLTFFSLIGMFIAVRIIQTISQEEVERFKEHAYSAKQTELKSAVEIAMKTINAFYSRTSAERVKKEVEQRLVLQMDTLINIITNYFNNNKEKIPFKKLKKDIIRIVQNARYGKNGYFWINDLHPRMVMHPFKPELNGKDLSNYKDPKGKHLFVEMVKVVREKGSGFVEYLWPKPGFEEPQPKISYVVLFKPLGWIIGTGAYIMDYIQEITAEAQREALYTLERIRFGKGNIGYFWVTDEKGKVLMHPIKPELVGTIPSQGTIILNALINKNASFVIYQWPKPGEETPEPKLSYVARFKPWHWIIGTGTYVGDIEKQIAFIQKRTEQEIYTLILTIVVLLTLSTLGSIVVLNQISQRAIFDRLEGLTAKLKLLAQGKFEGIDLKPSEDEIGEIEKSVAETINTLSRLTQEIEKGLSALREGQRRELDLKSFAGNYREMLALIVNFNQELQNAILKIKNFAYQLERGKLDEITISKEGIPPVFMGIIENLESTRKSILETMEYLRTAVNYISEGKFDLEIKEEDFSGVYKEILRYLKQILFNLKDILGEIKTIAQEVAQGNFNIEVKEERFKGEYKTVMEYLHQIILKLNQQLAHIHAMLNKEKELSELRKLVEEDVSVEDIYQRIAHLLENKFKIREYTLYEVNPSRNHMKVVLPPSGDIRFCHPEICINANLCRAKRTAHLVVSNQQAWGSVCDKFLYPQERSYFCLPLIFGQGVTYVLQVVGKNEDEFKTHLKHIEEIKLYLNTIIPILENKKLFRSLREKSLRDGLTGLYNRHFLEEYLIKAAALTQRRGTTLGILMADIDFFKRVNDEFGHDVGDKVLREIAEIILNTFRISDVAVRFGGEEFLILLHDMDEAKAINAAEKLRKNIEEARIEIPTGYIHKTISVGVALFPVDSRDIWEVIKYADIALYYAKKAGRNKVMRFEPYMWED